MRVRVVALNDADYQAWEANQLTAASLPLEGTPEFEGWSVYLSKGCTLCHTVVVDAPSGSNIIAEGAFQGPNLTHFASRDVFAGALLPEEGETHDEALKRWLANPPEVKPGSFMPNLALTEQEIDALIVWLGSNK
jgi:cytochrome c oxidase subunit 2